MSNEGKDGLRPGDTGGVEKRSPLLPVLICTLLSAGMMYSRFFSFFFLAPLGYIALVHTQAAWFTFVLAAVTNCLFSLSFAFPRIDSSLWGHILIFSVLSLGFIWIMAGGKEGRIVRIRTAYRFIIAAVLGAFVSLPIILGRWNNSDFAVMVKEQAELLSSVIPAVEPEILFEVFKNVVLRGGALFSIFFLFFVNRQLAITAVWLLKKRRTGQNLPAFHAPGGAIWFLSFSLAAILLARMAKLEIPEIAAWNVLVVCAILFLAQGAGIVLFILARRTMPPALRLIFNILIIIVVFSPGINTIALVALMLLGIAENWLPFRAPKQDGPASTPGL